MIPLDNVQSAKNDGQAVRSETQITISVSGSRTDLTVLGRIEQDHRRRPTRAV